MEIEVIILLAVFLAAYIFLAYFQGKTIKLQRELIDILKKGEEIQKEHIETCEKIIALQEKYIERSEEVK